MGFFANQRIKNGTKASTSEDREALPKNRLNYNVKPDVMKGPQGQDMPVNQGKSSDMNSAQQKKSKQFPR